jgi:hypothetical protein
MIGIWATSMKKGNRPGSYWKKEMKWKNYLTY